MGRRLTYPGDTPQKAVIREKLYKTTMKYWGRKAPQGDIVVLAGPEAKEVTLLRDFFRWPAERVLFVDIDDEGLRKARAEWPGVRTYHGLVHEAVQQVDRIALLNLDLMGMFNDDAEQTLLAAADRVLPRGVVSYTFYRAREHNSQHSFQKLKFAARRHVDINTADFETLRWVGTAARMQRCLHFLHPKVLLTERYSSELSPMGIMALANEPER